jgi:hypothetical protein
MQQQFDLGVLHLVLFLYWEAAAEAGYVFCNIFKSCSWGCCWGVGCLVADAAACCAAPGAAGEEVSG